MENLFLTILSISLTTSVIIIVLILLGFLMDKDTKRQAKRAFHNVLWRSVLLSCQEIVEWEEKRNQGY